MILYFYNKQRDVVGTGPFVQFFEFKLLKNMPPIVAEAMKSRTVEGFPDTIVYLHGFSDNGKLRSVEPGFKTIPGLFLGIEGLWGTDPPMLKRSSNSAEQGEAFKKAEAEREWTNWNPQARPMLPPPRNPVHSLGYARGNEIRTLVRDLLANSADLKMSDSQKRLVSIKPHMDWYGATVADVAEKFVSLLLAAKSESSGEPQWVWDVLGKFNEFRHEPRGEIDSDVLPMRKEVIAVLHWLEDTVVRTTPQPFENKRIVSEKRPLLEAAKESNWLFDRSNDVGALRRIKEEIRSIQTGAGVKVQTMEEQNAAKEELRRAWDDFRFSAKKGWTKKMPPWNPIHGLSRVQQKEELLSLLKSEFLIREGVPFEFHSLTMQPSTMYRLVEKMNEYLLRHRNSIGLNISYTPPSRTWYGWVHGCGQVNWPSIEEQAWVWFALKAYDSQRLFSVSQVNNRKFARANSFQGSIAFVTPGDMNLHLDSNRSQWSKETQESFLEKFSAPGACKTWAEFNSKATGTFVDMMPPVNPFFGMSREKQRMISDHLIEIYTRFEVESFDLLTTDQVYYLSKAINALFNSKVGQSSFFNKKRRTVWFYKEDGKKAMWPSPEEQLWIQFAMFAEDDQRIFANENKPEPDRGFNARAFYDPQERLSVTKR